MAKLWENTYRAVNIALANELADACHSLGLAPVPVIEAAATKPYGFMPFYLGSGRRRSLHPVRPALPALAAGQGPAAGAAGRHRPRGQQRPPRADHRTRPRPAGGLRRGRARRPCPADRRRLQGRAWPTSGRAPPWRSSPGSPGPARTSPTATPGALAPRRHGHAAPCTRPALPALGPGRPAHRPPRARPDLAVRRRRPGRPGHPPARPASPGRRRGPPPASSPTAEATA